jgi:hypothetical protein
MTASEKFAIRVLLKRARSMARNYNVSSSHEAVDQNDTPVDPSMPTVVALSVYGLLIKASRELFNSTSNQAFIYCASTAAKLTALKLGREPYWNVIFQWHEEKLRTKLEVTTLFSELLGELEKDSEREYSNWQRKRT